MRRRIAVLVALLCAGTLMVMTPASTVQASSATRWASASTAKIRPGVQMYTRGGQCTGNFVFRDRWGRVYMGYAAHCAGLGSMTDTNGCTTPSMPLDTRVRFARGGSLLPTSTTVGWGRLAYSSWLTMRRLGVRNTSICEHNDFALVRLSPRSARRANPTVPFWGGPTGLDRDGSTVGDPVYSYGNSSLRGGVAQLSPKTGTSVGTSARGWSHAIYTVTPGVPGDSGSGFLDAQGRALGTLSTLTLAPLTGSNGVGDLRRELGFARRHAGIPGLALVRGTLSFSATP